MIVNLRTCLNSRQQSHMQNLYTCRPSGALKGWCAVDLYRSRFSLLIDRTLQIVLFKQALRRRFRGPYFS